MDFEDIDWFYFGLALIYTVLSMLFLMTTIGLIEISFVIDDALIFKKISIYLSILVTFLLWTWDIIYYYKALKKVD